MKAISLWQPWASFIAFGRKTIETRSWSTQYRGPILIHAAKRVNKQEQKAILSMPAFNKALGLDPVECDLEAGLEKLSKLPYGAIIAQTTLIDCKHTDEIDLDQYPDQEGWLGDFSIGRYGWIFGSVFAFDEPIPYKGEQGLFEVPPAVVAGQIMKMV